jgi:hypothetical protein
MARLAAAKHGCWRTLSRRGSALLFYGLNKIQEARVEGWAWPRRLLASSKGDVEERLDSFRAS